MSTYTKELLLPQDPTPQASYRFGIVTSADPLRVRLDGETNPVASTPITLDALAVGDRVYTLIYQRQLVVLGKLASGAPMGLLGTSDNLNNFTETGTWHQPTNANTDMARNYPVAFAGLLEVTRGYNPASATDYVYQRYTAYNGHAVYTRTKYGNTWHEWRASNLADNTVSIAGRTYQASGVWPSFRLTSWSSVSSGSIYVQTWNLGVPYTPPTNYGFVAYLLGSSGFGFLSTTAFGQGGGCSGRYLQYANASFVDLTLGWQLVRVS